MRPAWLERLLWRLAHRHAWGLLQRYDFPYAPVLRQGCSVPGCGARRLIHDDGRRVGWRTRAKLEDWEFLCPQAESAPSEHSVARKRLDALASNLGRLLK